MRPLCLICRSSSTGFAWSYGKYSIFRCRECGLEFIFPIRGQGASLDYYQEQYTDTFQAAAAGQVHPGYAYLTDYIEKYRRVYLNTERPDAIDIGCGMGYVLSELKRLGYEEFGIDFNPDFVRLARERYGVNAEVGSIQDVRKHGKRFDLAVLNHVLEHVEDPLAVLRDVRSLLHEGGLVILAMPNRRASRAYGDMSKGNFPWFHYPPHHLTFWSARSLRRALSSAGFEVVHCRWKPPAQGNRIERMLSERFHIPPGPLRGAAAWVARSAVRAAGTQGEELFAAARRAG